MIDSFRNVVMRLTACFRHAQVVKSLRQLPICNQ
jgi:hypothetical protein